MDVVSVKSPSYLLNLLRNAKNLSQEWLADELKNHKNFLANGLHAYGSLREKTSIESEISKLKVFNIPDKMSTVVADFCVATGIEAVPCYRMVMAYFAYEYTGSERDLDLLLQSKEQHHELLIALHHFYLKELLNATRVARYALENFQNSDHPFSAVFQSFVEENFTSDEYRKNIFCQLEKLNTYGHYPVTVEQVERSNVKLFGQRYQWLQLQLELLKLLLWHFQFLNHSVDDVVMVLKCCRRSKSHQHQKLVPLEQSLLSAIIKLKQVVMLQVLEIDWLLYKRLQSQNEVNEHALLSSNTILKEIHDSIMELSVCHEHAVLFLGWAIFLFLATADNDDTYLMDVQKLSLWAKSNDALAYLVDTCKDSVLCTDANVGAVISTIVYGLVNAVLCHFEPQSLGSAEGLNELLCLILRHRNVALDLWQQEFSLGVSEYFREVLYKFPYDCTAIPLCTSLAKATKDSCHKVLNLLQRLPCYSESVSCLRTEDLQQVLDREDTYELLQNRRPFDIDDFLIPARTVGKLCAIDNDFGSPDRYVQWFHYYSAWQVCLLQLSSKFHDSLLTQRTLELVLAMVESDSSLAQKFVHFVDFSFDVLRSEFEAAHPNDKLLATAVKIVAVAADLYPQDVFDQMCRLGLLPVLHMEDGMNTLRGGLFERILQDCEILNGSYDVTIAFLRLVVVFSRPVEVRLSSGFAPCAMYILTRVFSHYEKWRYFQNVNQRQLIAKLCLEATSFCLLDVQHTVHVEKFDSSARHSCTSKSILKITSNLLANEARLPLLNIIGVGPGVLRYSVEQDFSSLHSELLLPKTLGISLSVLSRLMDLIPSTDDVKGQYSECSGMLWSDICGRQWHAANSSLVAVLARYLFYREDIRIPKLALMCLLKILQNCPAVVVASLGADCDAFCEVFCGRLASQSEDVHLRTICLNFVKSSLRTQPALAEMFLGIKATDSRTYDVSMCSCLHTTWEIICDDLAAVDLKAAAYDLVSNLWTIDHTIARDWLCKQDNFWINLAFPLTSLFGSNDVDLPADEFYTKLVSFLLKILSCELLRVEKLTNDSASEFANVVASLFSFSAVMFIAKLVLNAGSPLRLMRDEGVNLALPLAWKDLITVASKKHDVNFDTEAQEPLFLKLINYLLENLQFLRDSENKANFLAKFAVVISDINIVVVHKSFVDKKPIQQKFDELVQSCATDVDSVPHRVKVNTLLCAKLLLEDDMENAALCAAVSCILNHAVLLYSDSASFGYRQMLLKEITVAVDVLTTLLRKWPVPTRAKIIAILRQRVVLSNLMSLLKESPQASEKLCWMCFSSVLALFIELCYADNVEWIINSGISTAFLSICPALFSTSLPLLAKASATTGPLVLLQRILHFYVVVLQKLKTKFIEDSTSFILCNDEYIFQVAKTAFDSKHYDSLYIIGSIMLLIHVVCQLKNAWHAQMPNLKSTVVSLSSYVAQQTISILTKPIQYSMHLLKKDKLNGSIVNANTEDVTDNQTSHQRMALKLLFLSVRVLQCWCMDSDPLSSEAAVDANNCAPVISLHPQAQNTGMLSFSSLYLFIEHCVGWLRKGDSSRTVAVSPTRHPLSVLSSSLSSDDRFLICQLLEVCIYIVISQASLYLYRSDTDNSQKGMLKRDIASEVHSLLSRQLRKSAPSPSTPRKSPSGFHQAFDLLDQEFIKLMLDRCDSILL